ncbi:FHA domain-containing protein [Streptomyces mirabilis]|uniref:FHA domain-containing protein n=1 Tax=Streptomyces mirabilis TaxID=68239 RepID=UPI0038021EAA
MGERPKVPMAPELVLQTDTGSTVMTPNRDYRVGREPSCDIAIADARVSWHHAVLCTAAGQWTLVDEGSKNGTYAEGRRVQVCTLEPGGVLRFGNPTTGPRATIAACARDSPAAGRLEGPSGVMEPSSTGTFRRPTTVCGRPRRTVRIGRERDNDPGYEGQKGRMVSGKQ